MLESGASTMVSWLATYAAHSTVLIGSVWAFCRYFPLDALTRGTLQDEVRRICVESGQTAFMITHDVDEAIFLADKIVLMTNGPGAMIAEIVKNPLPRDRKRLDLHKHPFFYPVRNHLIDFLVERSRTFRDNVPAGFDRRHPPIVDPTAPDTSDTGAVRLVKINA